jgi:hypothetical protein
MLAGAKVQWPVLKPLNEKLWNAMVGMWLILRASAEEAYDKATTTERRPSGLNPWATCDTGANR